MPDVSLGGSSSDPQSDAFVEKFFARIPESLHDTFTDAQLDAIKLAFGARGWGRHSIDFRRSLPTPFGRHYVVLLLGRERRVAERWVNTRIGKLAAAVMILVSIGVFALLGMGLAYTAKRALGIDVVPSVDMLPDDILEKWLQ